jgi:hypothetical protein
MEHGRLRHVQFKKNKQDGEVCFLVCLFVGKKCIRKAGKKKEFQDPHQVYTHLIKDPFCVACAGSLKRGT